MLASLVSALVYLVVLVIVLLGLLVAWKGGRGAAVWLLDIYRRFNLAVLAFRGDTPASEAERRVVSGQAWADWCDTLRPWRSTVMVVSELKDT